MRILDIYISIIIIGFPILCLILYNWIKLTYFLLQYIFNSKFRKELKRDKYYSSDVAGVAHL